MSVKICGCRRPADARAAADAGASHVGLVFAERTRRVEPKAAAEIVASVSSAVQPVGVFVDSTAETVLETAGRVGFRIAQLHGAESPELCDRVRARGLAVWKAIRPRSRAELEESARRYLGAVDGLLVEGFSEHAAGGTGTGFPHEWLAGLPDRGLVRAGGGPAAGGDPAEGGVRPALILAGGLTPDNVGAAIRAARPAMVDVSSGVERAPGEKDPERIRGFVRAADAAFAALARPMTAEGSGRDV